MLTLPELKKVHSGITVAQNKVTVALKELVEVLNAATKELEFREVFVSEIAEALHIAPRVKNKIEALIGSQYCGTNA